MSAVKINTERARKYDNPDSKIKAFCSITIGDVSINNCRIVLGRNGFFLGFPEGEPYEVNGEEKRNPYIWIDDKSVLKQVQEEAVRVAEEMHLGEEGASEESVRF